MVKEANIKEKKTVKLQRANKQKLIADSRKKCFIFRALIIVITNEVNNKNYLF